MSDSDIQSDLPLSVLLAFPHRKKVTVTWRSVRAIRIGVVHGPVVKSEVTCCGDCAGGRFPHQTPRRRSRDAHGSSATIHRSRTEDACIRSKGEEERRITPACDGLCSESAFGFEQRTRIVPVPVTIRSPRQHLPGVHGSSAFPFLDRLFTPVQQKQAACTPPHAASLSTGSHTICVRAGSSLFALFLKHSALLLRTPASPRTHGSHQTPSPHDTHSRR